MGLDYGSKTIGVAVSDPLGLTAQGVETIKRRSREEDIARVEELIAAFGVEEVVVGLPLNMDGSAGPMAHQAERFANRIRRKLGLPVHLWDERLTTVAAERSLLRGDLSRAHRHRLIDRTAAQLILQSYLDASKVKQEDDRGE